MRALIIYPEMKILRWETESAYPMNEDDEQ